MDVGNSQQALAQLQQVQNSAQNPQNLLAQQQQQLGVESQRGVTQGLRGAIDSTTKLLKQVAPSVMGRTSGSLVTNAQATRQIGNEQAPIAGNLNDQTAAYGRASQDLNDLETRAQQAASAAYTGQQDRLGYLQNLYNTLYQREQAEADRQEQIRQFNEEQSRLKSSAASSGGGYDLSALTAALDGSGSPSPTASEKKYIGNDDFRGALAYEASKGNNDAKIALKYAGNDRKFNGTVSSQAEYDALKRIGIQGNYKYSPAKSSTPAASLSVTGIPSLLSGGGGLRSLGGF